MKHHFADLLDRADGHWAMTANVERQVHHYPDVATAPATTRTLMMTGTDANWEAVTRLTQLEELTLESPRQPQYECVAKLVTLKRLRVTHARPASLAFVRTLVGLEEAVLEYVSGVDDLAPLAALPRLRALHLENLRRVSDFGGLAGARHLRYLAIEGTLDWAQPIRDLTFVDGMPHLEVLRLGMVRIGATFPALAPVARRPRLKKVMLSGGAFALEEYAFLQAMRPEVDGATCKPYWIVPGGRVRVSPEDIRATMPVAEFRALRGAVVNARQERFMDEPEVTSFLGKGQRSAQGTSPAVLARREAQATTYAALVASYRGAAPSGKRGSGRPARRGAPLRR